MRETRIEHDRGEVEIVVYNRTIVLFTASPPTLAAEGRPRSRAWLGRGGVRI